MKIYGNTVGTTLPRPNFDQTDPKKGDFIKGDRSFLKGDDGAVFVPGVDGEGVLSWTNNGGLTNPEPVKIVGSDGYTPRKGIDYDTQEDRAQMVEAVFAGIPRAAHIHVDRQQDTTVMTVVMTDGRSSTMVVGYDDAGDPKEITVDGQTVTVEYARHRIELYAAGNVCQAVTGGWSANGYTKGSVTENKTPGLDTAGAMVISLSTDKNAAQGSVMTGQAVALAGCSRLCFQVSALSGKVELGYTDAPGSSYSMAASVQAAVGLNSLDISGLSGSYTIAIAVTAYLDAGAGVTIDSIYLE